MGIEPDAVVGPEIDETVLPRELPRAYALRMAVSKLDAGSVQGPGGAHVLAADTVVACGRRILPKTETRNEARRCLELLSGRRHRVYGGIAVRAPDGRTASRVELTVVTLKRLDRIEIERYLDSGEWEGKAGGYAIQGRAEGFVRSLNGTYSNVVGLPLGTAVALLRGLGWRPG